jgi:type II secretory pathway component PulF
MPLTVTPGQLFRRADMYHQLGQLIAAGISLTHALQQVQRHPPSRSFARPLGQVIQAIDQGHTFSDALRSTHGWLPEFDITLLEAGERSGRMDVCFLALEEYYSDRGRMMRQMIFNLLYPVGLLHFAVLIFAFVRFIGSNDLIGSLTQMAVILVPIYVVTAVLIFVMQSRHGETWRSIVETVLHPIPMLGTGRRELALARLTMALEALINAGVTIIEAWDLASRVSGSPALARTVRDWRPEVLAGQTPAEAVNASGKFPDLFASQYMGGEVSGKLDEVLRRLTKYYREEGSRKLNALAQWFPHIAYLIIAILIGFWVVRFYMGYFQQIKNVMP